MFAQILYKLFFAPKKHSKIETKQFKNFFFFVTFFIVLIGNQCFGEDVVESTFRQQHRPTIFDQSICPRGWSAVGEQCAQLQFEPKRFHEASTECQKLGAELIRLKSIKEDLDKAIVQDVSYLINEIINSGINELTWLIGDTNIINLNNLENKRHPNRLKRHQNRLKRHFFNIVNGKRKHWNVRRSIDENISQSHFALRKKVGNEESFEIADVSGRSAFPFICSLTTLRRKALIYEQVLLPRDAPVIIDDLDQKTTYYHYAISKLWQNENSSNGGGGYFVRLPCRATGIPTPVIRWFSADQNDEIDVNNQTSTVYLISGGSLFINTSNDSTNKVTSYFCTATNQYGTVRSASALIRPVFMEPFRDTRLDVYPLKTGNRGNHQRVGGNIGIGTRIDCNAPRHYPKSYTYSWVYGGSTEKFVNISERIFISMDGTLYFAYNIIEDADLYACALALTTTQSAQHGPFFRLIFPQFQHLIFAKPQTFAPRIDEYQPIIFPEFPLRGETVYIECFAYGFPAPIYKWNRADGIPLSDRHHVINYGRILRIDNVNIEDAVRYKCLAQNELSVASAEIQLIIQMPPTVLRPMIDQLVALNGTAIFQCLVTETNSGTKTRTAIEWFHDGRPLVPLLLSRSDRRRIKILNNELQIIRAKESDSGVYQCLVTNDVGSASVSSLLTVKNLAPKFHANILPSKIFVLENTKLQLPCLYHAKPRGQSFWRRVNPPWDTPKNGVEYSSILTLEDENYKIAVLRLDNIQSTDAGNYECVASNIKGKANANVQLIVLSQGKIRMKSERKNGNDGGNLNVICEVEIDCRGDKKSENQLNINNFIEQRESQCPEAFFDWKFNDQSIRSIRQKSNFQLHQQESFANIVFPYVHSSKPNFTPHISKTVALASKMNAFFDSKQEAVSKLKNSSTGVYIVNPPHPENNNEQLNDGFYYSPLKRDFEKNLQRQHAHIYHSKLTLSGHFADTNVGRFSCFSAFGVGAVTELEPSSIVSAAPTQLRAELLRDNIIIKAGNNFNKNKYESKGFTINLSWRPPSISINKLIKDNKELQILGFIIDIRTMNNRYWRNIGFAPYSNATILQTYLIYSLQPNQRYQFRLKTKNAKDALSVASKSSNWLDTPQIVPQEGIKELRYKIFDGQHLFLEWDPIETDYSSAPNLCYNVSWTTILPDENLSTIDKNQSSSQDKNFTNFKTVKEPNMMILIPPNVGKIENKNNENKCYRMKVSVWPFNDIGLGRIATNTIIHVTKNGPRRQAENVRISSINSTHLNLTWDWLNAGECENAVGTQIICDEMRQIPIAKDFRSNNLLKLPSSSNSRNIFDVIVDSAINQSVPAHYKHWMIYGLKPATFYRCRLVAFDQYGRFGVVSASTVTSTGNTAPAVPPEITYIRLKKTEDGGFALLLDWRLLEFEKHVENKYLEKEKRNLVEKSESNTGYKIFVYDSETAERPTVLTINNAELADSNNPSVRIDGLKTMFYYSIQIAGFNSGGLGPLSKPMPIRVGATQFDINFESESPNSTSQLSVDNAQFFVLAFLCFIYLFD